MWSLSEAFANIAGGVDQAKVREWLEGPMRGVELFEGGCVVLHGSCIRFGEVSVSIVGPSGVGKSTIAALLVARGAKLISDGMTPIRPDTRELVLGPPRAKLNDESIRLLGHEPTNFERVHGESLKRYFPIAGAETGGTLDQIIILEDSDSLSVERLSGADALIRLVRNVYLAHHLPPEYSAILLERMGALIRNGVGIKVLRRAKEPGNLPRIIAAMEAAIQRDR